MDEELERLRGVVGRFVVIGEALLKLDSEADDWWAWQHEWGTAWEDGPLKLRLKEALALGKAPVDHPQGQPSCG